MVVDVDDTGQDSQQTVIAAPLLQDVMGKKVICDGLLCSILRSMSNAANKDEFVSVIERDCDEEEILASRRKLFTFYNDVVCDKQKKPVIQITRGSVRKNIEDIVEQMVKIDKVETSEIFYMPWDYVIKPFKGDTEVRAELIEKELSTEFDAKIDTLKNEMNIKNQALLEVINNKFNEVIKHVSTVNAAQPLSFAAVAGAGQPQPERGGVYCGGGGVQAAGQTFKMPGQPVHVRGRVPDKQQGGEGGERDRSASKRRRIEDTNDENTARARSQSQSKQKKFVVGTSNQAGRKMRSPPADIFVYGVHPDTSPEDIVQDLAFSDIIIKAEDIVKKSKDEAFLKSYKISVKAEDLLKALDPAIWPMRVKVREFIHYSRRPGREGQGYQQQHGRVQAQGGGYQHQQGQGYHYGRVYQHQQGHSGQTPGGPIHQGGELQQAYTGRAHVQHAEPVGVGGPPAQFLAPNKYALPEDNVPGGVRHDV